ncbi:MAG: hypothetical protein AB1502_04120 [Thermodesulfobacteriota bacterium]
MGRPKGYQQLNLFYLFIFMISFFYPNHHAYAQRVYGIEEEEVRPFTLRELSGALDFRLEYEDDKVKSIGEPFQQKRTRLEERLDIKSRGSIYHPNLLEFNINTSFGLGQEWLRGDFKDYNNLFPYEYGINLNFLRQKAINFNLFANRSSDQISRQFFEPINIESESYGGVFRYQNKLFPMTLILQSQSTKEDSRDYRRDRIERTADLRISNKLDDLLKSEFKYIYKDLVENNPTKQEVTSHDFSLYDTLDYDNIHGNSNISYLKTLGALKQDQYRVLENFYIDHSKTFSTLYNYNFSRFVTENFGSNVSQGSFGFRHKLYESLITEVREEIGWTGATDLKEFYHGPNVSLSYRKNVPGGVFSGGYNFLYRKTKREAAAGVIRIFGERIVLSDAQRTFLANPNVIFSSVVVRDVFGVILTLDVDYRLITSGISTEIQRVGLPDNTPVLVDYDFSVTPLLKYDTVSNGINLRYDYKQLFSLYYNYLNTQYINVSQDRTSPTPSTLSNILKSLYGAELKWRWFNFVAEYEDDDSDLIPFTAWRVRGNFNISLTDYSLFGLNASHSQTNYKKEKKTVRLNIIDAFLRLRLNSFLDATLGPGYLREKSRDIDTRVWKIKGDLRSQFRSIEMRLESEYLNRRELTQTRNEFLIKFKLIRYFNIF